MENKYFVNQQLHAAIDGIENILPHIDKDTILLHLKAKALLEVEVDGNGKQTIAIKDPSTKAPYRSSATANYTSLPLFIQKEILEAKGWIAKQNPKGDGGGDGNPIGGDGGKKKWKIHKNATNALGK